MEDVWYKDGLRFHCTQCGRCCYGIPGVVWVSDKECEELAKFHQLTLEDFQNQYTRLVNDRRALLEKGKYSACIFLMMFKLCTVYPLRPKQCKTFPWWKDVLSSKENWEKTKEYCEGINHPQGVLRSREEIDALLCDLQSTE